jgi:GxxExxY protein
MVSVEQTTHHRLTQINTDSEGSGKLEYPHADLTAKIIGAAMEVHRTLGNGFLEGVYEEAMAIELVMQKVPFERQKPLDVKYKGRPAKQFVCDMLVDSKVLVELKASKGLCDSDMAQVLNYLKATGLKLGLLINFGTASVQVKRVIFNL